MNGFSQTTGKKYGEDALQCSKCMTVFVRTDASKEAKCTKCGSAECGPYQQTRATLPEKANEE